MRPSPRSPSSGRSSRRLRRSRAFSAAGFPDGRRIPVRRRMGCRGAGRGGLRGAGRCAHLPEVVAARVPRGGGGRPARGRPRLAPVLPGPLALQAAPVIEGKRVAVVVPAYDEEQLLPETLAAIPEFVDRIYVVDDASRDGTLGRAQAAAAEDPRITVIGRERNGGVGAAIVTGYR